MNAELYRDHLEDYDIHWSHVGPSHQRLYFNLIALVGYAPAKDAGRFLVYTMAGDELPKTFATIPAAKRAARNWVNEWILQALKDDALTWSAKESGYHFTAENNGISIASYYKCDTAVAGYHKGFKVFFGGTYYTSDFKSVDEARAAVDQTWREWLGKAAQLPKVKTQ